MLYIPKFKYSKLPLENVNKSDNLHVTTLKSHDKYMAVGFSNSEIKLYDPNGLLSHAYTLKLKPRKNVEPLPIKDIDVNSSGSHIVACTDTTVALFNLENEISPNEKGEFELYAKEMPATGCRPCNRVKFVNGKIAGSFPVLIGSSNLMLVWWGEASGVLFKSAKLERRILDDLHNRRPSQENNTISRTSSPVLNQSSSSGRTRTISNSSNMSNISNSSKISSFLPRNHIHSIEFSPSSKFLAYASTRSVKVCVWNGSSVANHNQEKTNGMPHYSAMRSQVLGEQARPGAVASIHNLVKNTVCTLVWINNEILNKG